MLLLFAFAGFAKAQGPASTAHWFGYILPPSPAENKYVSFTMQDLGSVSVASETLPAANTATFANGYVWSVNNDNGYNICRSSFDAANNQIGAPEVMVAGVSYVNDMAYNPADNPIDLPIKIAFDMLTGELFGVHYGNLYQLDPNTGTYTMLGALHDGSTGYDPTCLFMTYGSNPTEFTVGDLNYRVNNDGVSVTVTGHVNGYEATGPLVIPSFCFHLTGDLTIPNSVETIGAGAFFQCSGFNGTLTIGESVKYIGDYAFRQCSHFTGAISLATTPPELGNEPGWNCVVFEQFGTQVLTVPYGCAAAYQNSNWYDPMGLNGFYEFIEAEPSTVLEAEPMVLSVYPNPTMGVVRIEAEDIKNISIFNLQGAKVYETSANGNAFEYDFNSQAAGTYFIKVETAKGVETKRVTVLKT